MVVVGKEIYFTRPENARVQPESSYRFFFPLTSSTSTSLVE
jgi:hypothetical protein